MMPPGLRQLEALLFSVGRITHMLEMNFEVLQHFLNSAAMLCEKLRALYSDAALVTSAMGRQSLEFGESSLSTAQRARSRLQQHPIKTVLGLVSLSFLLLMRYFSTRRRLRATSAAALPYAFANTSLDAAWPQPRK